MIGAISSNLTEIENQRDISGGFRRSINKS
jgi:hypothetical protein